MITLMLHNVMVHDMASWMAMGHWSDLGQSIHWAFPTDWVVMAQQFKEPDIAGDVGKTWNHFVKTGQVWAFLIGAIFGYLAKTFTTYG